MQAFMLASRKFGLRLRCINIYIYVYMILDLQSTRNTYLLFIVSKFPFLYFFYWFPFSGVSHKDRAAATHCEFRKFMNVLGGFNTQLITLCRSIYIFIYVFYLFTHIYIYIHQFLFIYSQYTIYCKQKFRNHHLHVLPHLHCQYHPHLHLFVWHVESSGIFSNILAITWSFTQVALRFSILFGDMAAGPAFTHDARRSKTRPVETHQRLRRDYPSPGDSAYATGQHQGKWWNGGEKWIRNRANKI